jgi:hypothetical protein
MKLSVKHTRLPELSQAGVHTGRQGDQRRECKVNAPTERPRLVWTPRQVVQATHLSHRLVVNLKKRCLLRRCYVGLNIALYSNAGVKELFADGTQQTQDAP